METNYLSQLRNAFKNLVLNAVGADRDLLQCLADSDVFKAVNMMTNNDTEVDEAINEYNHEMHKVMFRKNKPRKGESDYITEKLPRTRQRYINEIELFFLLGKPLVWSKDDGDDEDFGFYKDFIKDYRINSLLRKAKRVAGSETESALVFNLMQRKDEDGNEETIVKPFVAARSTGYRLRTMFNQYGELLALAYSYRLKENGKSVLHYDILTKDFTFYCRLGKLGWEVTPYDNPTGKINAIYFRQKKSWDGVQARIEREEMLDSKGADTNNYFSDPMAAATADVLDNLADPDKPGRLIQLTGEKSRFEYINPPQNSQSRTDEKKELKESILFDSFTPDFSYENMKGFGSLSGIALKRALILGFMKRDILIENYGPMVDRMKNVIIEILKLLHPERQTKIANLKVGFEFGEPFSEDKREMWQSVINLYNGGLISLETGVGMISLTDSPEEEIDRIIMREAEREELKVEVEKEILGLREQAKAEEKALNGD